MAGISYSDLVTQIRNYTETDSNVLTTAILENIILNSQYRIMRDIPIDADRLQQEGNLVTGQERQVIQILHLEECFLPRSLIQHTNLEYTTTRCQLL